MSKADYIPRNDNDLIVWLDHFSKHLLSNYAEYNISQDDIGSLQSAIENFHNKIAATNEAQAAAKRATAEKNDSRNAVVNLSRSLSKRIKADPIYTEAKGMELGISGPEVSIDLASAKPILIGADQTGGQVTLKFTKLKSNGLNIYCQRENDTNWVLLGRATISPFIDKRALLVPDKSELRRYCAVYMLKDNEIGQFSDELVISCVP